jgi:hypothetical protein
MQTRPTNLPGASQVWYVAGTMRISRTILFTLLACSVPLTACDDKGKKEDGKADAKKDEKADAQAGEAKAGEEKEEAKEEAKADGPAEVTLAKAGLKGMAPAGSKVSEMMGNDMVQGPDLVATVEPGEKKPATPDDAKKDADMYSPENLNVEELEDGYVMTFTNKGGMGTNYWVQSRREIDGTAYFCSTTASKEEQQKNAVEFCKSLKK